MTIHGIEQSLQFSLTQAKRGQEVCISGVSGGRGVQDRLYAMGLAPGIIAKVLSVGGGPVVLSVFGSRLVLGHGMAAKVRVRAIPVGNE